MAFWLVLLLYVAVFILSEVLKPKPKLENARPAGIGDFQFPTATEGRLVPILWGTVRIDGPNVLWYGDLRNVAIREKVKTGIFSSKHVTIGYKYFMGVQHGFCRGVVDELRRIWVGEKLVYSGPTGAGTIYLDKPNLFGGEDGQGGIQGYFNFQTGTDSQTANSYLAAHQQISGQTPGYRGTSFGTFEQGYVGTITSIQPWAFELKRIPTDLGGSHHTVNTYDANPAHVIYELLTDSEWGLGFPGSDIDTTNFLEVAAILYSEGNGFSYLLDRGIEIVDLLRELERQIDGVVVLDRTSGKWKINIARADYDIDLITQLDDDDVIEVTDFTRGSWEETINEVKVKFHQRSQVYKETFAIAQDMANVRIQGINVPNSVSYPGVKDSTLANSIAWRELRALSYPLAKATIVVDRSFSSLNPGEVVAWTDDSLDFVKMPMRVTRIDLGELQNGKISLSLVQDVFTYEDPSFGDPGDGEWEPPDDIEVVDIPVADRKIFEAPKAFVDRDPSYPINLPRVWGGFRYQDDMAYQTHFNIDGVDDGTVVSFLLAGKLKSTITAEGQGSNIDITADPDTQSAILTAFGDPVTDEDIGEQLSNIILIDDEFFGCKSASSIGDPDIRLVTTYRGLLDSTPKPHASGTRVWLLFIAGGLNERTVSGSLSIKPLPESPYDKLTSGEATATALTTDNRYNKPYPPVEFEANSDNWPTASVSLDVLDTGSGAGTTWDDEGINVDFRRRDYRTLDEVAAVKAEDLPSDFPTANSTKYLMQVRNDPDGLDTLLFTTAYNAGLDHLFAGRTKILRYTDGVLPTKMKMVVETRHTVDSVDLDSTQNLEHSFDVSSSDLGSLSNLGAENENVATAVYQAQSTGTFTVEVGRDLFTTGTVQVQINSGGWNDVITTGKTGSFSATSGDNIEFRHTQGGADTDETLFVLTDPGSTDVAYAVFIV